MSPVSSSVRRVTRPACSHRPTAHRPRRLSGPLEEALDDTPVVVVAGPRQAGTSTLAAHGVAEHGGTWLSLDDATTLDVARDDPVGFVSGRTGLVGIDGVQRVPELLLTVSPPRAAP